jgi:F0F1-type ATP synthase epsilon subunit
VPKRSDKKKNQQLPANTKSKAGEGKPPKLYIYMRSRNEEYFRGEATSLTSVNETGEFDILSYHANFITMVKDFVIIDKGLETENKIEIESGVLSVLGDKIDIYVGL